MLMVKCPTCRQLHPYDRNSPWRPFCSERCRLIDLGRWADGSYRITGEPGSADPDEVLAEARRRAAAAAGEEEEKPQSDK